MKDRYMVFKDGDTTIVVDRIGGQLVSMRIKGVEILSQGALYPESSSWHATAKNLFPNPGKVGGKYQDFATRIENGEDVFTEIADDLENMTIAELEDEIALSKIDNKTVRYSLNKVPYRIAQHGFAQKSEFQVRGKQKNGCVMSIETSPETLKEYPFKFRYNLGYEVEDGGVLRYDASCSNLDDKPIVAGMGWHPAFVLHDDNTSAYKLVFSNLEKTKDCKIVEGKEYSLKSIVEKGQTVTIDGIISADVKIVYHHGYWGRFCQYISMHTESPKLVLWSKPIEHSGQKKFICIEPWNTDSRVLGELSSQEKIREIEGANVIEPKQTSNISATIEVGDEYIHLVELTPIYDDTDMQI